MYSNTKVFTPCKKMERKASVFHRPISAAVQGYYCMLSPVWEPADVQSARTALLITRLITINGEGTKKL